MIVTHFNTFLRGGASTAAQQLHWALARRGVTSRFQTLASGTAIPAAVADRKRLPASAGFAATRWRSRGGGGQLVASVRFRIERQRFKRAVKRGRRPGAELFTWPRQSQPTSWPPLEHPANAARSDPPHLVHLHWVAKFLDWPSFFASLPPGQPVIWTLHDMNPLTGGCHFSEGCQRFRQGCGHCPQLGGGRANDFSARAFRIKRDALRGVDLHVAAPSRWLLEQARSSPIFEPARSFSWIPYGMPSERLYPIEQQLARRRLGLAPDRFVVAFGAMSLSNRRKGARELQAALGKVAADREVCGLVFGAGEFGGSEPMPEIKHVGPISDDATRRDVYSAADLFVLPSLEDNLPLTGLEAMACATPVLGFRSGGIPDYVRPHETGILVDRGDAGALGEALEAALRARDQLPAMGQRARQRVLHQFESRIEAGAYCRLYEQVLADGLPSVTRAA